MKHFIATAVAGAALLVPVGPALARPGLDPAPPTATAGQITPAPDAIDRGKPVSTPAADGGRYVGSDFVAYSVIPKGSLTSDYPGSAPVATPVATHVTTTPVATGGDGFDWADAAIGGGAMVALVALASGGAAA